MIQHYTPRGANDQVRIKLIMNNTHYPGKEQFS